MSTELNAPGDGVIRELALPSPVEATVVQAVRRRAITDANRHAFRFLDYQPQVSVQCLTFAELDERARRTAARLQKAKAVGERVLLIAEPGLDFITSLFGCLYAGAIAVPAYPPDTFRLGRTIPRLLAMIDDSQAKFLIATQLDEHPLKDRFVGRGWDAHAVSDYSSQEFSCANQNPSDLALLQYTSGSTGVPRGVMLTHGNLMANVRAMRRAFDVEGGKLLHWLPPYHDMGLIGGIFCPSVIGRETIFMSPFSFMQKPLRWFEAIDEYRVTTTTAPNFGYEVCLRKIKDEDCQELDLSCLQIVISGAERVRISTLRKFAQRFAKFGFCLDAFRPSFGLAESTLMVSGIRDHKQVRTVRLATGNHADHSFGEPSASEVVSCGRPAADTQVVIVDPDSCLPLGTGEIGEIWVASPSNGAGYWRNPEATRQTFHARLAGGTASKSRDGKSTEYLRTGDLGFVDDQELFVTGRIKELVVVGGCKFFPQDLELAAATAHAALKVDASAAFSVEDVQHERLILVHEVKRPKKFDLEAITTAIRQAILEQFQIVPDVILLVQNGALPKTSSGKTQRRACREAYLAGKLKTIARWSAAADCPTPGGVSALPRTAPQTATEKSLAEIWQDVLGLSHAHRDDHFFDLGGRSLAISDMLVRLERQFQVKLALRDVFAHPTLAELAAVIDRTTACAEVPVIPFAENGQFYPLSFSQQRFWLLENLGGRATQQSVVSVALRLRGKINAGQLDRAFQGLVRSHAVFRTAIEQHGGTAQQSVRVDPPCALELIDCGSDIRAARRRFFGAAFDLHRPPLIRAGLLSRAHDDHELLITVHHLVCDEASLRLFVEQLADAYRHGGHGLGPTAGSQPRAIAYTDFAHWQRDHFSNGQIEPELDYWRGRLSGANGFLDLPADFARPTDEIGAMQTYHAAISQTLQRRIEQLARRTGATPFVVHLAAYQTYLAAICRESDISIGIPVAGRDHPQLQTMIGCLINTIVVRDEIEPSQSFAHRISHVRKILLEDLAHADVPFERVVEAVQPARRWGVSPLAQALLVQHQSMTAGVTSWSPGVDVLDLEIEDAGLTGFDLALVIEDETKLTLAYNERLFLPGTAQRMLVNYVSLLDQLTAGPRVALVAHSEPPHEVEGPTSPISHTTVYQRWREMVAAFPHRTAVEHGEQPISYRQLDQRALTIAATLADAGVTAGDRVAISVARHPDMIALMLAIWQLEAAYVPIDANYPAVRIADMLEDCEPRLLVVDERTQAAISAAQEVARLVLPPHRDADPILPAGDMAHPSTDALAYVMYTSGSTGRPKGVMVPQSAVVNLLESMAQQPGLVAGERLLAHTTISFDISVLELFLPLVVGATVVLAGDEQAGDGQALQALIDTSALDVIQATPSAFRLLLETGWRPTPEQRIVCGGEPLKNELGDLLAVHAGEVWNVYGPTETTIWSTVYRVLPAAPETRTGTVPIGRPIANTRLRVCDEAGNEVARGANGELWIGGAGVAAGYWNRALATDQKFVTDTSNGPIFYRTGDLVRERGDGALEFIARVDNQVKVRGYRIELGEIEAALTQYAEISDAVAVAHHERLVGYFVGTADRLASSASEAPTAQALSPEALRRFLRTRLPEPMIPTAFIRLDELPRTPAGKIDRQRLPSADGQPWQRSQEYVAAQTPSEVALAALWQELLSVDRIGVCDSFFELGGHSLVAMQMIARLEQRLAVKIPIRDVFTAPTIRELAARIDRRIARPLATTTRSTAGTAPQVTSREIPLLADRNHSPLSFAEQRMWFSEQLEPAHPFYNMPLAARVKGALDEAALRSSFAAVVDRHESLRTTYDGQAGEPRRKIHSPTSQNITPQFVDLCDGGTQNAESMLQHQMYLESRRPFDLVDGPLLRCTVYRIAPDEHMVLLVMHHIVSDGWSMGVMLRELAECYRAHVAGGVADLRPLELQYADFAVWQRQQLDDERIPELLGYWKRQLAGAPTVLDLPLDHPRPAVQDFAGQQATFALSPRLTSRIRQRCTAGQTTPFTFLLSAYFCLLARLTGQTDICIGTAAASRSTTALESLIGFFVNTLVVRGQLDDNPTFHEFVGRVAETTLEAQMHGELPFEKLVEHLVQRRDRSHSPIFQAGFVYQNPLGELPVGPGLSIESLRVDNGTAKHDLTFEFEDVGDQLIAAVHYRTALFERETIERFIRSFQLICEAAVADPQCRVTRLPAVDPPQRKLLLDEFNDTAFDFGEPHTLHQLIESHTNTRGRSLAMIEGDNTWTYHELSDWSDQIAAGLIASGVTPGANVLTYLPRSAELEATMLAILKVGARYVPLDTQQPLARCQIIIRQCKAAMIIVSDSRISLSESSATAGTSTIGRPSATQPAPQDVRIVDTATLCQRGRELPTALPQVSPDDIAYIIFTSGSTGVPKGVPVRHHAIANFARAQARRLGVSEKDRVLHAFPPSFDGGLSEAVLALGNGATSVIAGDACIDPKVLVRFLRQHKVTVAKFTPSRLTGMEDDNLPDLRVIVTAADTLTGELAAKWATAGRRFFNGYGPTESTVGVSMYEVRPPIAPRPPIGGPMSNMRMYVLDQHRQPVPLGAVGEIFIGGTGVVTGYLGDDASTREKFTLDPFARTLGRTSRAANCDPPRMYATGDLGRWNRHGQVEFVGRVDRQIKIRGYRVEPDEIAAQLKRLDGVTNAVVTVGASSQLVAYVVTDPVADSHALAEQHVANWQALFHESRRAAPPALQPEFDIGGWIDSYTGRPLDHAAMREWLDTAVANVMAVAPRRVLEIGCGTGLILFRVAPHVEHYTGTDLLESSLDQVASVVDRRTDLRGKVRLLTAAADDLSALGQAAFDTIVINSVVQYFPNVTYLLKVLDAAVERLARRGRIVLGDIRSKAHLHALATGIELAQADDDVGREELARRVRARVAREEELLVDPEFFFALQQRYENLTDVIVQLKAGRHHNELTRYRYEVVLRFDTGAASNGCRTPERSGDPPDLPATRVDNLSELATHLQTLDQARRFVGLINARVADEVAAWESIPRASTANDSAVHDSAAPANPMPSSHVDPQTITDLATSLHIETRITWDPHDTRRIEVIAWRSGATPPLTGRNDLPRGPMPWSSWCNNPLADRQASELQHEWRVALKQRLPDYMIPSAFVVIDSIPQTSRGKVDFEALPTVPETQTRRDGNIVPASTPSETALLAIWESLLGVHPVGVTDDFFELGGHSMLAIRLMSEIEAQWGREIPLAALFHDATVRYLAALIDTPESDRIAGSLVPLQTGGQGAPLFCIHPAGGTVFCYRGLAAELAGSRPVFGLQAVGIDGRSPAHTSVGEMAAHYATAMVAAYPPGPYHLAGWSLGGTLALEVARQLQASGHAVGLVALLDSAAIADQSQLDEDDFVELIAAMFPAADRVSLESLRRLAADEQLAYFVSLAAQAGLAPAGDLEAARHVYDVFRANVKALHEFRPVAYDGPVLLLRPRDQALSHALAADATLGWQALSSAVDVQWVAGDHAQMVHAPHVAELARVLDRVISRRDQI